MRNVGIKVKMTDNTSVKGLLFYSFKENHMVWQQAKFADKTLRDALELKPGLDHIKWATDYQMFNTKRNGAIITLSRNGQISPDGRGLIYEGNVQLEQNHPQGYIVKFDHEHYFRGCPKNEAVFKNCVSWDIGIMAMNEGAGSDLFVERYFVSMIHKRNWQDRSVLIDEGPFANVFQAMIYAEHKAMELLNVDTPFGLNYNEAYQGSELALMTRGNHA